MLAYSKMSLWFDVESRYKATLNEMNAIIKELWFDVESRYKATLLPSTEHRSQL